MGLIDEWMLKGVKIIVVELMVLYLAGAACLVSLLTSPGLHIAANGGVQNLGLVR